MPTLRHPRHGRMPDLTQVRQAVHQLRQPAVFVTPALTRADDAELRARIQQLEAEATQAQHEAATAKQQLHAAASQAWLAAETQWQQQQKQQLAQRRSYAATAVVHDNTQAQHGPQVVATARTVYLKQPLDPVKAVPMDLPWMSLIKNWFMRKP